MPVFLFSDIESSTELWQKFPDVMESVLARHDALLGETVEHFGGRVVKHTGDGIFAVFEEGEPLECALEIQKALIRQDWGVVGELRVRLALNTGEAQQRDGDYFGLDVSRTARLLTAGWGGQILLSHTLVQASAPPEGGSLQDLGVHVLKDLSEPQHIWQLSCLDLPVRQFPALRTLSAHPHNLPPQPTPFVGRAQELAEITRSLNLPSVRLLTLVGPGGIGKTRLALQAAAGQVEQCEYGVYFVALAPLHSSELILPAIAEALKFAFSQRETPKVQLLNYLREKSLLLVLDNFEHLIAGADLLAEILSTAPRVKALVTSRERLNLREETVFQVEGMRYPAQLDAPDLDEYSSVKLFMQTAQRSAPEFRVDVQDRPCIARICRLVDGGPLGIELAAGWLRLLSCQEIANEIEASLDFLSTGLRDVPERHRSLRAVFDYSWKLLSPDEQNTLACLAVFRGAFRREAAMAILCGLDTKLREYVALQQLAALVGKSLLKHNTDGSYELHNLMRQYALERLNESPERVDRVNELHAAFFSQFMAQREAGLQGAKPGPVLSEIAAALDDIRAAWMWAVEQGQWKMIAASQQGLYLFFSTRGRSEEGQELFGLACSAIKSPSSDCGDGCLAWSVQIRLAIFEYHLTNYEKAQHLLEESLECLSQAESPAEVGLGTLFLGNIAWMAGNYPLASQLGQEALEIYRSGGDLIGAAEAFDLLGVVAWSRGDYPEARQYFEQALELMRPMGQLSAVAKFLDHLGVTHRELGEYDLAKQDFLESQAIAGELDAKTTLLFVSNHMAGIALYQGLTEEAVVQFRQTIALAREIGDRRAQAYNLLDLGSVLHSDGRESGLASRLDEAGACLSQSLAIFQEVGEPFGVVLAQGELAAMQFLSDPAAGKKRYFQALQTALEIQNPRLIGETLNNYAYSLREKGCLAQAVEILGCILKRVDDPRSGNVAKDMLEEIRLECPPVDFSEALERAKDLKPEGVLEWLKDE